MESTTPAGRGVAGFVADLRAQGCDPVCEGDVITYKIRALTGMHAGEVVDTAVNATEVNRWPTTPAHWIHFPEHVTFAKTNSDTNGCAPGWQRHSRNPGPWRLDREPIAVWLAHVRGVIGEAI